MKMDSRTGAHLNLEPRSALRVLGAAVMVLIAAHVAGQLLRVHVGPEFARSAVRLFDLDAEGNVPTMFSSALLLLNAFLFHLAWLTSTRNGRREGFWLLMTVVFGFLSMDEIGTLHEKIIQPLREALPGTAGGLFRFAWVIPYGIAAAVLAVLSIPVLRRIGRRLSALLALSGVIYLLGALGMEMIGGRYLEVTQQNADLRAPAYVVMTTSEEALEMTGLVLLVYALLNLLQEKQGGFTISLSAGRVRAETASARSPARLRPRWLPPIRQGMHRAIGGATRFAQSFRAARPMAPPRPVSPVGVPRK